MTNSSSQFAPSTRPTCPASLPAEAGAATILRQIVLLAGMQLTMLAQAQPSVKPPSMPAAQAYSPGPDAGEHGGGVALVYQGQVAPGREVQARLSSDYTSLMISGAVRQVITVEDLHDDTGQSLYPRMENTLTDERSENGAGGLVDLSSDFNHDGHNDLSIVSTTGSGATSYLFFLYQPGTKKYVFHAGLSKLDFLYFDKDRKQLVQALADGEDVAPYTVYQLDAENRPYKAQTHDCHAVRDHPGGAISHYVRHDMVYASDGREVSHSSRKFAGDPAHPLEYRNCR